MLHIKWGRTHSELDAIAVIMSFLGEYHRSRGKSSICPGPRASSTSFGVRSGRLGRWYILKLTSSSSSLSPSKSYSSSGSIRPHAGNVAPALPPIWLCASVAASWSCSKSLMIASSSWKPHRARSLLLKSDMLGGSIGPFMRREIADLVAVGYDGMHLVTDGSVLFF